MRRLLKAVERQVRLTAEGPHKVRRLALLPFRAASHYWDIIEKEAVLVEDEFDRLYGTETSTRVYVEALSIPSHNWIHSSPYFPTPSQLLPQIVAQNTIDLTGLTFVDLGSGKGRMLLMASQLPFRGIVGVEFSPDLVRASLNNIAVYKGPRGCSNVEVVCGDFTEFEFPSGPLFVFLYNPASLSVTQRLADNLARSLEAHPREVWALYVTPYQGIKFGEQVSSGECCGHPYSLFHSLPANARTPQGCVVG